jgi:RNA polymerase sigma factor (sigma-70 family)
VGRSEEGQATWSGGERARFAGLVREHGPAVHAYLARRAGRQLADDLFGEVGLRAWRSHDSYDPSAGGVLPWLIGIARNSLRAHFRLRADNVGRPVELRCDPWGDTDDRLDAARLVLALERALAALSGESREILLLVAWEQLSPAEIAQSLQIPPGTVRSRLHRARSALKDYLHAELELRLESEPEEVCG